jgi:hypothetical protein
MVDPDAQDHMDQIARGFMLQPPEPTLVELARNFGGSVRRWVSAGFPVAKAVEFDERLKVCQMCESWDATGNVGAGKCKVCKCTKIKLWMATEKCPKGKWE